MILNNLKMLHSRQNGMAETRKEYQQAPKIDREQARKNPLTYLPEAMMLNNLKMLHSRQNGMAETRKEYQ